jgi:hypothetical protein
LTTLGHMNVTIDQGWVRAGAMLHRSFPSPMSCRCGGALPLGDGVAFGVHI